LYFVGDGALVICSHIFLKQSQKAPRREVARACRLRDAYEAARAEGTLRHCRSDEDVLQEIR
jgi:hypothetical protein